MPPCEAAIQRVILARLSVMPGVKVWRSNTGSASAPNGRHIRFNTPGAADLSGLLAPYGRRLEIEVKSERGRQSPAQRQFQALIESMGGLYVLAYDVDTALAAVRAALDVTPVTQSARSDPEAA